VVLQDPDFTYRSAPVVLVAQTVTDDAAAFTATTPPAIAPIAIEAATTADFKAYGRNMGASL
jgi:hypothetical protein